VTVASVLPQDPGRQPRRRHRVADRAQLPLTTADPFAHAAARHGVTVTPGSAACVCGTHVNHIRLSFAERPATLELAAERLAAAWASHAADLAATPLQPTHAGPFAR
jgi:hypothetical protein